MADPRRILGDAGGGLVALFVRHRTLANLLMAVMIVAGLVTVPRMRAQFFPDTVVQTVSVTVAWPGAGAEDVDRAVVGVIEPALLGVEGVADLSGRAVEGRAILSMDFEPGWDMARAVAEVETAVAGAGTLPEDAEDPEITRGAWRDRVADVVLSGPVGLDQLARFADDLVARLYVQGITRVTVEGIAAPEIEVRVGAADLERHDVTLAEIAAVIGAAATAQPAGDVASGAARVRTGSEARDPASVAALILRARPDGTALTVGDVARVTEAGRGRANAYQVGADPAVVVQVQRSARGDAIGMQRQVEAAIAAQSAGLPESVDVRLVRARAEQIEARLNLLIDNAMMGLALVVGLLFLFLNARTALWVAAGIPTALLTALALMHLAGMTINMISLFALILTLGIIVDDAIVVGEHADYRHRVLREPPALAAANGAGRMLSPVVSSTLTTVIAFAGLAFIGGRFGDLIFDIPLTVIAVLAASLVECFLVLPHHMAHALAHAAEARWYDRPSALVNRGLDRFVAAVIRPLTAWVWRLRWPVIAGTLALLAWAMAQLVSGTVPWRFFDSPEQGSVAGNFAMLPGADREDTRRVMTAMQDAVAIVAAQFEAEHGVDPILHVMGQIGGNSGRPLPGADSRDPDLLGAIQIELVDADQRPFTSAAFVQALQAAMPADPQLETISFRSFGSGPGGDAISAVLSGAEAVRLKEAAEALKARLAGLPGVSALEDSMPHDKEELALTLTAQGRALGFTTEGLARELRQRLAGIEAASFPVGTRSGTIRVLLPEAERRGDFLDRMRLRAASGAWVPLADIVTVDTRAGFSTIRRQNGVRTITVTGDLAGDDPANAAAVTARLERELLPALAAEFGVTFETTGLAEQERDFQADAAVGFGLALLGIYMVLSWIFASWTRPLVVMAVIPFGLIGAVYGHWSWGVPLSMFSVVGLIGMSGIIINDSIVLISTIDEYAQTRGLRPAVIDAIAQRFRPVMLTTATTVLGLAPLLFESSQQAQFLKPTVIALAYGLGFGFVVVLLVVPAVLAAGTDLGRALRGFRRARRAARLRGPIRLGAAVAAAGFAATILPATLAPALDVALPAGWPVAAGAGQALTWYAGTVLVAVALAAAAAAVTLRREGMPRATAAE